MHIIRYLLRIAIQPSKLLDN